MLFNKRRLKKSKSIESSRIAANIMLSKHMPFIVSEAYKSLRTSIEFSMITDEQCKILVVTSPSPGEGKSSTSINLAVSFAQLSKRVLIIDADLRLPRVHRYLNIENSEGLSDYLAKFAGIDKCVRRIEEFNFDCMTSGRIPPNPLELMSSRMMKEMLEMFAAKYDYIIIDTPPINVVSEAVVLSKLATGTLLAVRENYTSQKDMYRAVDALKFAEANLIGVVLTVSETAVKQKKRKRGYVKYGYSRYDYSKYYHDNYYREYEESDVPEDIKPDAIGEVSDSTSWTEADS